MTKIIAWLMSYSEIRPLTTTNNTINNITRYDVFLRIRSGSNKKKCFDVAVTANIFRSFGENFKGFECIVLTYNLFSSFRQITKPFISVSIVLGFGWMRQTFIIYSVACRFTKDYLNLVTIIKLCSTSMTPQHNC